ncbi:MAG: HlyD family type I secretion periplasmic adaptor subunit [Chromatiaceae bacterium]|nr:HlyD family type I secretion periplasmic adaptor subunit [Chromatiaceae bacterium]
MRSSDETAFLPAAIEIQETPPAPAGRSILWAILAFFTLGLVWATVSDVDIVAVAPGRIIPSGYSKSVQPLEIGRVTAIHVREGQDVQADDVLIELDPSSAQADVDRLLTELDTAKREVRRFETLSAWLQRDEPPSPVEQRAASDALLLRRWREFEDHIAVLERERDKLGAEQRSARQQVEKLEAVLPIVSRRARDQKSLAARKLLPEQQSLESEQQRLEVHHDLATQQGRVAELDAGIEQLRARIEFTRSEFHRQVLERLEQAQSQQTAAQQESLKAVARLNARTVTAPVAGVVQQLAVHNTGAIVTPAEQLMVIVPQSGAMEVEANLENKDIGFVEVGQRAEIKIDTFPFTKYGTIAGKVIDLSNDAVADQQGGLIYKMRVQMERSEIDVNGKWVQLSPGMTVLVESMTGKRKMIEFFLSPLLRYTQESVRER